VKRIVFAAILHLVAVGGAFAADLPLAPPPPLGPYVPVGEVNYNWAGIYLGANGGYGFANSTWSTSTLSGALKTSGFVGGGTLGVNFQFGRFVFGAETDLDGSGMINRSGAFGTICANAGFASCQTRNTWQGTTRGRAGFALDRVFLYATGGAAYGNVEAVANGLTNTTTKAGWTAGAGVEVAITEWNWTAKLEYLYVDLGNGSCTTACPGPAFNVGFAESLVRAGVNYKFSF